MLMDIYAKINLIGKESIMNGRVLMDEDYHFEGVLNTENKMDYQLVVGEALIDKNYSFVEFVLFRKKDDSKFPIRIHAERELPKEKGYKEKPEDVYLKGKVFMHTDLMTSQCGECIIGIHDGEKIREVRDDEIEYVKHLIEFTKKTLNTESKEQLDKSGIDKQYVKMSRKQ